MTFVLCLTDSLKLTNGIHMTDCSIFSPIIRSQENDIVSATKAIIEMYIAANAIRIILRG